MYDQCVWVSETEWVSTTTCADLTDVTLAGEDTNSILTDNANRAIQGNVAMQVGNATWWPTLQTMQMVPHDDQILNQSKLCHLLAKFATNANGAIWWPNLQPMQVVPSDGRIFNQCKWRHLVANIGTNASGAIWWPNLQLMQEAPIGGQICNSYKWRHLVDNFATDANGNSSKERLHSY